MLKVKVEDVIEKLTEYGMALYTDYPTEDQGHCFITKGMIVFLDEEDDSLSITFQADSKPEDVASNMLILSEIDEVTDISVMESFIYDKENNFLSGTKAHELVKNTLVEEAFQKIAKEQAYALILNNSECYEC